MISKDTIPSIVKRIKDTLELIQSRQRLDYSSVMFNGRQLSNSQYDIQAYFPTTQILRVYDVTIYHTNNNNSVGRISLYTSHDPNVMANIEYPGLGSIPPQGLGMISSNNSSTTYRLLAKSGKQAYVDDTIYYKLLYEGSDTFTSSITFVSAL